MVFKNYILLFFADEDKTFTITDNVVMGVTGEAGDVPRFAEYITQNVKLYRMRNGYNLSIPAIATFTRKTVAEYLRSQVIIILATCRLLKIYVQQSECLKTLMMMLHSNLLTCNI